MQYSKDSQIFLTSHSPAFFKEYPEHKTLIRVGKEEGKTVLLSSATNLDEELGYIELYRGFLQKVEELQKQNQDYTNQVNELKNVVSTLKKPIILTEGKTDASLLELAISKLGLTKFSEYQIHPVLSDNTSNNTVLLRHLNDLRDNIRPSQPVIGMFDRDTPLLVDIDGQKIDIRDRKFVQFGINIYAFAIPIPHGRVESDQISIEHYFTDKEIKTELEGKRLFLGNEFYSTGVFKGDEELFYLGSAATADTIKIIEHTTKKYVTKQNGTGDYSISKEIFVESIRNNVPDFSVISFSEFQKIFDVINDILIDSENKSEIDS